jgi:hypothetical protein
MDAAGTAPSARRRIAARRGAARRADAGVRGTKDTR